jgi:hypothetical protein
MALNYAVPGGDGLGRLRAVLGYVPCVLAQKRLRRLVIETLKSHTAATVGLR